MRPLLALEKVAEAAGVLDEIIRRFPKSRAVRPAARAAVLRLQEMTDAMIATNKDPGEIASRLGLIDRYAAVWLAPGPDRPRSREEALRASEKLHANALRLNGLDDSTASLEHDLGSPEGFLAAFTQSAGAVVAFIDTEERVRFITREAAAWLGMAPEAVIGRTLRELH